MTNLVATQLGVEVWGVGTPALVATQLGVEMYFSITPQLVATQLGVEVWFAGVLATQSPGASVHVIT